MMAAVVMGTLHKDVAGLVALILCNKSRYLLLGMKVDNVATTDLNSWRYDTQVVKGFGQSSYAMLSLILSI